MCQSGSDKSLKKNAESRKAESDWQEGKSKQVSKAR